MLSTLCWAHLPSEASFLQDPLSGLSLLLFGLESQEFVSFSPLLFIAIEDILDLSAMRFKNSVRNQHLRDRCPAVDFSRETHPIAPTTLLLDLVFSPLFSADLAPHFVLGLAVPGRGILPIIVNGVIQGVLELIKTRKGCHGGIELDITGGWEGEIGWDVVERRVIASMDNQA